MAPKPVPVVAIIKACAGCGLPMRLFPSNASRRFCTIACQTDISRKFLPEPNSGCWLWLGAMNSDGYGTVSVNGRSSAAHRAVYEKYAGKIPAGLILDHLCRNPSCVNPGHLEPVTYKENYARAPSVIAKRESQSCRRGHPWLPETTRVVPRGVRHARLCILCSRELAKDRTRRRAAAHGRPLGAQRLTTKTIVAIRGAPGSSREIARRFGVGRTTVNNIKSGAIWSSVEDYRQATGQMAECRA